MILMKDSLQFCRMKRALCVLSLVALLQFEKCTGQGVTTEHCGVTKGCFRNPPNCVTPACTSLATWNYTVPGYIDFELMAVTVTPGWVALGLSYDSVMGNDSVMDCYPNTASTGAINVDLSYNKLSLLYNRPLSYSSPAMSNKSASISGGTINCRFRRAIPSDGLEVYRLDASYYLLLGYGPLSSTGAIAQHNVPPTVSQILVNVASDFIDVGSTPAPSSGTSNINTNNIFRGFLGSQVSWQMTSDSKYVQFAITVTLDSSSNSGWVSVGFSTDQNMDDDSVIDCIRTVSGTIVVQSSYNYDSYNEPLAQPQVGVQALETSYANTILTCNVIRPITGVGNAQVFDLNKSYYLFLATGAVGANGVKQYHGGNKVFSNSLINLLSNSGAQAAFSTGHCDECLKRAHACLMITAWVLMVSTSIIIARYFKTAWPGKKIGHFDVWFVLHMTLMILALICTITAFVIIFVANWGKMSAYPDGSPSYYWIHARLGIAVMILVIINPVMAIFRCKPDATYRPIFNWLHWLVGTVVHVLAIITIFFGAKIGESNPNDVISHMAVFWILIAFVGFHVIVEILLSLNKCVSEVVSKNYFQVQYEMSKPGEVPRVMEPYVGNRWTDIFRYSILTVYFLFVLTLWMAMIILIGSGNVGYGHTYL